jgi:hypothetical protein
MNDVSEKKRNPLEVMIRNTSRYDLREREHRSFDSGLHHEPFAIS